MFTAAVIVLNQATNKTEAVNLTFAQLNQAFLNLDKTVRYATAISTPGCGGGLAPVCNGTTSGDWYVELRSTTSTGLEQCTQLRVDITTQQLQQRTWFPAAPTTTAPNFIPLASGITNGAVATGSTDQPFALVTPGVTVPYQQLTINLVAVSGSASTQATTSRSKSTFSALNSSIPPPTSPFCQLWQPAVMRDRLVGGLLRRLGEGCPPAMTADRSRCFSSSSSSECRSRCLAAADDRHAGPLDRFDTTRVQALDAAQAGLDVMLGKIRQVTTGEAHLAAMPGVPGNRHGQRRRRRLQCHSYLLHRRSSAESPRQRSLLAAAA